MTTPPEATTKRTEIDEFTIPEKWSNEAISPRVMLGRNNDDSEHEWALAPMSGRTIAAFTAHAIGMSGILGNLLGGEVDPTTGEKKPPDPDKIVANIESLYRGVHFGLIRGYPDLEFDTFFDMPIKPDELLNAFWKIAEAAGVKFEKVSAPGEVQAAPEKP